MAGIFCVRSPPSPTLISPSRRNRMIFRCSSRYDRSETPRLVKTAINGVTQLLRFFRSANERSNRADSTFQNESSALSVDDVLVTLKSDYERAYFLTGNFTSAIYAEDCSFEDPTIKFRGKDLYSRNLELLVPFFECPSLALQKIEKGFNGETEFVVATWALRWRVKIIPEAALRLFSLHGRPLRKKAGKWYDFDPAGEHRANLSYRSVGIRVGLGDVSINGLP